ncbi:FAD:protein FMN transferase [Flavihumibacter profundi]|uniref:FAD:protein FMN transferase n=1 Tax=Flavihumibacter profundi TaxID=2716883 RepID=UPI001CC5195A|nr:FAD:protein FMN transferase [Flavihumibacter profundi]MBZ5858265.1 FAD:protein FMN transferase [Flavihumibacter profundi]
MRQQRFVWFFLFLVSCAASHNIAGENFSAFHIAGFAQGTTYSISYYAKDSLVTKFEVDSIFNSIDSSLSVYKPYSTISKFNEAVLEIAPGMHLGRVVKQSLIIYKATNGISDITVYPLVREWGFGTKKIAAMPDSASIKSILACVGSDKIFFQQDRLVKKMPCVKIDVNGIGQGYTVDVLADYFEKKGIQNYIVEVGGELRIKGHKQPGNIPFSVGIESPPEHGSNDVVVKRVIQVDRGAVTTSGNYRRYYESNGKVISHLINPKSGYPVQNELISVTVYAKDATTADGYDNALMGMGLEQAFQFLAQHKEMEAYFIYHNGNGLVADTATKGFNKLFVNNIPRKAQD